MYGCVCLEQLYQSAFDKREKAAAEFEETDIEFQNMKIACSQLSDELRALKENSPEASPILSDFTPFEDIPQTAAAPLLVCIFFSLENATSNIIHLTSY